MTDEAVEAVALLPCPFDGWEAEYEENLEWSQGGPLYWVRCSHCRASPGASKTKTEAIINWNSRQPVTALLSAYEANRIDVEELRETRFMALLDEELARRLYPVRGAPAPAKDLEGRKAHAELVGHVGSFRGAVKAVLTRISSLEKKGS